MSLPRSLTNRLEGQWPLLSCCFQLCHTCATIREMMADETEYILTIHRFLVRIA